MEQTATWFIALGCATVLTWWAGAAIGRRSGSWSRICMVVGPIVLLGWCWLQKRPAVATQLFPAGIFRYLEGTAAVPIFTFMLGLIWARAILPRQRRLAAWATALAVLYLFNGGLWMIQTTPVTGYADTIENGVVMQSQDFTCVPASCATALNQLGIQTSEAEMAILTHARPGTGATLIRAMEGLNQRLRRSAVTNVRAYIVEPTYEQLCAMPLPALTPLKVGATKRHMVVLISVNDRGAWIADPISGTMYLSRHDFEDAYTQQVLAFERD